MAATNVGKSIALTNTATASYMPRMVDGVMVPGHNTILVTCEMRPKKIGARGLGILTDIPLREFKENQEKIRARVSDVKGKCGQFEIYEMPPNECSVDHISAITNNIRRTRGWSPKVIIIDYLDLLASRHSSNNKDDYTRQKSVSTEVTGLAKKENAFIATATQTNRSASGGDDAPHLNQVAESFGKTMPLDYIVSLGQTFEMREQTPPLIQLYVVKNRDGQREVGVECTINYNNMQIRERL